MLQWDRAGEGAEILHTPLRMRLVTTLQWDRAGEGAEIKNRWGSGHTISGLQSDRAGEGAEIDMIGKNWTPPIDQGFNGTAPVKARKSKETAERLIGQVSFNGTAPVKARK